MSPKKKKTSGKSTDFLKLDIDEQVQLVNAALEPEVFPALQMDGGGLEIMDIQGTDIYISYYGACGNCSIGTTATLPFIEQTLQTQVDPRIKVVLVDPQQGMKL